MRALILLSIAAGLGSLVLVAFALLGSRSGLRERIIERQVLVRRCDHCGELVEVDLRACTRCGAKLR